MLKKLWIFFMLLPLAAVTPAKAAGNFEQWLGEAYAEAKGKGISEQTLNEAFSNIQFIPRVIELDRKQPEGKMTFAQYKKNIVSKDRIEKGRRLYQQHKILLDKISAQYGVQPQYIVALWGIETNYGSNTGGFNIIPALATLAYDGRRSEFFRDELMTALKIADEGHISVPAMKGSWAGAMGQNQFMPSSFKRFAVDGNGDGRRDIWTSLPDVFASTANYLSKSGWRDDERWGREVKLPANFPASAQGREIQKSLAEWSKMGVTLPGGGAIPAAAMTASIVCPDGVGGPAYLIYDNYRTIMKWNKSTYFATSVGLLADQIAQ